MIGLYLLRMRFTVHIGVSMILRLSSPWPGGLQKSEFGKLHQTIVPLLSCF